MSTFNTFYQTLTKGSPFLWAATFFFLFIPEVSAQISEGGIPYSFSEKNLAATVPLEIMPEINIDQLREEDAKDEAEGLPPRFGAKLNVNLTLENSGLWETLPNGGRLWRLQIYSEGALSINLLYDDFYLPQGGKLYIYSRDKEHLIGAFTSRNNKPDRLFVTGLVYGDAITLEYYEPRQVAGRSAISISHVVHGYRYINPVRPGEKAFDDSGDCNVNVICSQGDGWRDEIKSVALILVGGSRICTGWLVNNTAQDCRPLFLTANHCLVDGTDAINDPNANNWNFMWRYESPTCSPSQDGPTNLTTSGATLLANPGSPGNIISSDFALFELAEDPGLAGYGVYYAGFEAGGATPLSVTGIHHPRGDVKKISMENDPLSGTAYGSGGGSPVTHWRVGDWDSGTTEKGSSGSPIFDGVTKRSLGFLSGGAAACGNDSPDWYGQIAHAWNNGGATDARRRLKDHLDPVGGGSIIFINGSDNPCKDPCVNDFEDPSLTCPPEQTGTVDANCDFELPDYRSLANASDNCTEGFTVSQVPAPGTVVTVGTTSIELTATDASGNSASCSFDVVVSDVTPPVVITQDITVQLDVNSGDVSITPADVDNGTYDNCNIASLTLDTDLFDCYDVGENTVTLTADDGNGNTASETATVTVEQYPFTVDAGDCTWVYYGYAPEECTELTTTVSGGSAPYTYEWSTTETTASITVCPTENTVYTVVVTDANGCTTMDEVLVEAIDVRCGKKLDKVEICHIPRGNPEAAQTLCVAFEAVAAHLAHGDQLAACGTVPCDEEVTITPEPDKLLAGSGLVQQPGFSIYPNPASTELIVDLPYLDDKELSITVLNSLGQPMWTQRTAVNARTTERIDLSGWNSGIYLIAVQAEGEQVRTKKFILQKE